MRSFSPSSFSVLLPPLGSNVHTSLSCVLRIELPPVKWNMPTSLSELLLGLDSADPNQSTTPQAQASCTCHRQRRPQAFSSSSNFCKFSTNGQVLSKWARLTTRTPNEHIGHPDRFPAPTRNSKFRAFARTSEVSLLYSAQTFQPNIYPTMLLRNLRAPGTFSNSQFAYTRTRRSHPSSPVRRAYVILFGK
ncbi:hypothetical protein PENSPDRAFT_81298 [Peniophora sp. CONT]|nr:hypothetical protein PENSPDRAFT_81298 [Peniophora sp. CONT]